MSPHNIPETATWVPFGWQGISALVPDDWSLAEIGGDFQSGRLRLDDADMTRLWVKWSSSQVDFEKELDRYLANLSKKARRGTTVTTRKGLRTISRRRKPDKRIIGFEWESSGPTGHVLAQGCAWRCRTCNRTVVSQVMALPSEDVGALAHRVLDSMQDHDLQGRHTWALYGLVLSMPKEFLLQRQELMSYYMELAFSSGKQTVRVERWGMASMLLADKSLAEWARENNKKRKGVSLEMQPQPAFGHDGLALVGHTRRPLQGIRTGARRLVGLKPAQDFFGQVWHCPASNRIYGVEGAGLADSALVREVSESIVCHR
jgi:hypothetical protein